MSTALLFKLVWNTQKIAWTSTMAICFLILKMFWCLNAPPYCFFLNIFEDVKFLLTYNLRNITKQNWYYINLKILTQWCHTLYVFPSSLHSLCPMWVQSGISICLFVWLTLKIRFNF